MVIHFKSILKKQLFPKDKNVLLGYLSVSEATTYSTKYGKQFNQTQFDSMDSDGDSLVSFTGKLDTPKLDII